MKIYLDTNVFISLFQEEIGFGFRALHIEARDFFESAKKKEDIICISQLFLSEVHQILFMKKEQVIKEIEKYEVIIELLGKPKQENLLKFNGLGIHHPDYIHAAIAFENCDCIVTFNIKDFEPARKFISLFSPADL